MGFSRTLRKIWKFIWHDDSVWSWIVNVIIAFVLVKFLIYPGIGLALSTSHPVVAVVSCSMEHNSHGSCSFNHMRFDEWYDTHSGWYNDNDFTEEQFKKFSFKNGFNKGDIMVLKGVDFEDIELGDVIVFNSNQRDPIIHRVVKKWEENNKYHFQTKGDNNAISSPELRELDITEDRIIGKAVFRVPALGWVKILAVDFINLFRGG